MFRTHNERVLSGYPGSPDVPDLGGCPCHCHDAELLAAGVDLGDCVDGIHDPDICIIPDDPPHPGRDGVCLCTETESEARAMREAEEEMYRTWRAVR